MQKVPEYIKRVKAGEIRLMGFGHRVYKNYDPRARIIKQMADEVFELTGKNPLLEIALELERIALEDDYFVKPQAVSERGFLFRHDLPVDGIPGDDVSGAVCHSAHVGLDCPVGGNAAGPGTENCTSAADLFGPRYAVVHSDGATLLSHRDRFTANSNLY